MSSEPPTLVFIPGSWHKPSCYSKVITLLQDNHHLRCVPVTNPSTTGDPNATFKDDLDAAQAAIAAETTKGRNVIVVAHSYGGIIGSSAIKGFARPKTTSNTNTANSNGYVVGFILIATGFAFTGLSFMDPFLGRPPPQWVVNKETGFADIVVDARQFFYHDLPRDEGEYWVSQLTPHSLKSLFEGGEYVYAGWQDVPNWYIGTIEDQGLPVVAQRMTVAMAREMGAKVEHRELQTSHSPFLSQPDEVAEIMVEAVESVMGRKLGERSSQHVEKSRIAVPAVRIFSPLSWFRFGLPSLFGRMIGRGILTFRFGRRVWRSIFG
ncbi:hypothetical protein TWF694_004211 [Orbilia ellipsospora]|uniref:AB hydrolase-1 domain-containing protein n=1 Tax=Orbilia ellipsospora TaxID=2528407 RepID=A0AAV9WXQ7_9PEZI